jgi:tetratricopeptide (TPR) repeat protein
MRVSRLTLALGLALGTSFLVSAALADDSAAGPTPPMQVASLPVGPTPAPAAEAPKLATPAPKLEGKQVAQLIPASAGSLSASDLTALAYEYAWHEDYEAERAWLEAAVAKPVGIDVGRALVHLAESRGYSGDAAGALALLDQVRREYQDVELLAFADLVQALVQKEPSWVGHGQRFYTGKDACLALYADAAQNWNATYLGGWASLRLAGMYRSRFAQPEQAIAILDQIAKDYAGTPFAEYSLEDAAAAVTFSLNRFGEGRQRYEQLLATTESDFVRQRATLHLGEALMDADNYDGAHETFASFIATWPWHAETVGAHALKGSVCAQLNRWDEAVAEATEYLAVTSARMPAHVGRAHLTLGKAAFAEGNLALAEVEFAQVDDALLAGQAKAGIGQARSRRGDLSGSLSAFLEAASAVRGRSCEPLYLHQAGRVALRLGDQAAMAQILQTMTTQFPYSHFTTLLAGRNVAPPLPAF